MSTDNSVHPALYRNFDLDADPPATGQGPVFDLGGETFHCLPEPPGLIFNQCVAAIDKDLMVRTDRAIEFLVGSLVPEDEERFTALLLDKTRLVTSRKLGELFSWLIEAYTGRPTVPPSA
jgi:hypothetical protein